MGDSQIIEERFFYKREIHLQHTRIPRLWDLMSDERSEVKLM